MKKIVFSLVFLTACIDSNLTTNSTVSLSEEMFVISNEQLDCHDPSTDVCIEPDYSKDVCEVAIIDVYTFDPQCKDNSNDICR